MPVTGGVCSPRPTTSRCSGRAHSRLSAWGGRGSRKRRGGATAGSSPPGASAIGGCPSPRRSEGAAVLLGGIASGASGFLGIWWFWGRSRDTATSAARWLRFGGTAWRGSGHCAACGHAFRELRFRQAHGLRLLPGAHDALDLVIRCPARGHDRDGGLRLSGREGERVLRRVLAHRHHVGASEGEVRSATRLIEEAGSPLKLARLVVRNGRRFGEIQRTGALGLEIAANEHAEQRLLELELAELEATWKHEEELAVIVVGELTSVPLFEQLRRRMAGQR